MKGRRARRRERIAGLAVLACTLIFIVTILVYLVDAASVV